MICDYLLLNFYQKNFQSPSATEPEWIDQKQTVQTRKVCAFANELAGGD